MKEKRLVKKVYINNAAPIKTTILTGEKITVLRKTVWVASSKVIFACKRDWQMNSSYSDLFTGSYFLKREGNEPEITDRVTLSCQSHTLACTCTAAGWRASLRGLSGRRLFLLFLWGRACTELQGLLRVGTLPGSTEGCGVGFLSENVYYRVTALHGVGELLTWKSFLKQRTEDELKLTHVQALVLGAVRTGAKSICGQGWAGMLRTPWILL